MNFQEQLDALEAGIAQLIGHPARNEAPQTATQHAAVQPQAAEAAPHTNATSGGDRNNASQPDASVGPAGRPILHLGRPAENTLALTIDNQSVVFNALQLDQLIETLANVRASMQPETPGELLPGWRFVATRNPGMVVKKQGNGDRLLILRHTGHGWVPFTLSPDWVIQLYTMLTQR